MSSNSWCFYNKFCNLRVDYWCIGEGVDFIELIIYLIYGLLYECLMEFGWEL